MNKAKKLALNKFFKNSFKTCQQQAMMNKNTKF